MWRPSWPNPCLEICAAALRARPATGDARTRTTCASKNALGCVVTVRFVEGEWRSGALALTEVCEQRA